MLQWQVAPENRTFEAMAVVGSRMNIIYWIDRDWLAKNCEKLFRLDEIERSPATAHGWAAWNAFLVWVMPHADYFRIFESQFRYAVEQAATVELAGRDHEQPMHRLGEHLMVLFGRGVLDLNGTIIQRFLETANADIRRHAIGFVGRSVEGSETIPGEIIKRFMALWDFYWPRIGKADAQSKPDAWLFGPWFASGRFPGDWGLNALLSLSRSIRRPNPVTKWPVNWLNSPHRRCKVPAGP